MYVHRHFNFISHMYIYNTCTIHVLYMHIMCTLHRLYPSHLQYIVFIFHHFLSPILAGIFILPFFLDQSASFSCIHIFGIHSSTVGCIFSYSSCFITNTFTDDSDEVVYKTKVRTVFYVILV